MSAKLLQLEKEKQEIAQELKEKMSQLQLIHTSIKSLEADHVEH